MTSHRRPLYFNPNARSWTNKGSNSADGAEAFHSRTDGYHASPLIPLHTVAKKHGVKAVYVKDETNRPRLPAVNNLGLSWAIFRALAEKMRLPDSSTVDSVKARLAASPVTLFTASDGNHGRAVARVGSLFATPVQVHVPSNAAADEIASIRAEGAKVVVASGESYQEAVLQAGAAASQAHNGLLVQEEAGRGHSEISQVDFATSAPRHGLWA